MRRGALHGRDGMRVRVRNVGVHWRRLLVLLRLLRVRVLLRRRLLLIR
jgi:hypothetical protein